MALQLSVAVRNARLAAIEATISTSPKLRIYDLDDAAPATCAAAMGGSDVLIAEMSLPVDWMGAPDAGVVDLAGVWTDLVANNPGKADFFRIWDTAAANCHLQGTVSQTGGAGDMKLDEDDVLAGQTITITQFQLTEPHA